MTIDYAPADAATLATISIAKLASPKHQVRSAEIARLREVCETVGFFYISEHGLPESTVKRIFRTAKTFFALPEDVKKRWASEIQVYEPRSQRGYHGSGVEQLNPLHEADSKQTFEFGPDRPLVPGKLYTGHSIVPSDEDVPDFMKCQHELMDLAMQRISPILARALALALGVEEDFFLKNLTQDEMLVTQRVTYYPARSGVCGRHTDSGLFTLLLQQSQVGNESSLKMYSQGRWRNIVSNDGLLVVNLGNILQFWSNGRFVSTPHQVVHKKDTPRYSVPIFVYPNASARMVPIGGSEDEALISGEVYANDIKDIWKNSGGAGKWTTKCSGKETGCKCWRC